MVSEVKRSDEGAWWQWIIVGCGGSWWYNASGVEYIYLLIIRGLSPAANLVCRPPACFVEARFRFNQASDLLFSPSAIMAPP